MQFRKLIRLYHTVRYLKIQQVFYRLYYRYFRIRRRHVGPLFTRTWASSWRSMPWLDLSTRDAENFTFLGISGVVREQADWQAGKHSKLWLYNLHYLDDLNARGIDQRHELAQKLIQKWNDNNPPFSGEGWEPYPLSLRIVNLVRWSALNPASGQYLLDGLGVQVDALSQQVEYHILGNHIFANGKALVFSGAYFSGDTGDRWLSKGLHIIDRQVPEQFLQDGGHFELSPMYHATLLWDMCDLVQLAQCSQLPALQARLPVWREVVVRGLIWLESMLHPDGEISFFNDSAFGIAPKYSQLLDYASHLGIALPAVSTEQARLNSNTGYVVVSPVQGVKALLDVAEVGPDYQPGHAHADTLSFELSIFGRRFIVNSGTSQYGEDQERQRQRSTSAHSTVQVEAQNSSEVWAGFRVARRARPMLERFEKLPSSIVVQASHDGYCRLPGRHLHKRSWTFTRDQLNIVDTVTGENVSAVARFFIHPDVQIRESKDGIVACFGSEQSVHIQFIGADDVRLVASTWHPEFGRSTENYCIEAAFTKNSLVTRIRWSLM